MSPVTTACTLRVGIADLARAVTAVVPHAEKSKPGDEQAMTCRVRLIAGKDALRVCATDGRTSAIAWVSILADSRPARRAKDDGDFVVDLRPRHARSIAGAITPNRVDGEDIGDAELELTVDTVTVTDVSGKYPDTSHTAPVIEQEATMTIEGTDHLGYPDLPRVLSAAFTRAAGTYKPLRPPARALAKFETAAAAYESPLVFEPVGGPDDLAWLVWARDAEFMGTIESRHEDDAERRRRGSARLRHLQRLGLMTPAEVAAEELKAGPIPEPDPEPEGDEPERIGDDEEEDIVTEARAAVAAAEFSHPDDDGFAPTGDDDEHEDGEDD